MARMTPLLPALLLGALIALPGAGMADEAEPPATLSVSGHGEVTAAPDLARVSVGVTSEGQTAAQALSLNSRRMAATLAALEKAGIPAKDIRTTNVSLSPVWSRQRMNESPPKIEGYRASNTVQVTARDLDALGPLLDAVTKAGANSLGGISFDLSNREDLTDEARAAAVRDARRKAEILAETAGVTLGGVLSIREGGAARPVPMAMARMEMAADGGVPIAEGEQVVSAQVAIVFEIE